MSIKIQLVNDTGAVMDEVNATVGSVNVTGNKASVELLFERAMLNVGDAPCRTVMFAEQEVIDANVVVPAKQVAAAKPADVPKVKSTASE
jgi:hypothetical protein